MEDVIAELKPNTKKIVLLRFLKVLAAVFIVLGLVFFMRIFIGFSIFEKTLSDFGFELDTRTIIINATFFAVSLVSIFLFLEYLSLSKVRYLFYEDNLKCCRNFLIIQISELVIHYDNITKVTFEKTPFLKTGNLTIELTGMEEKSITLKCVDNTEQVASDILKLINQYRSKYYAQKSEEYKYDRVLNREDF